MSCLKAGWASPNGMVPAFPGVNAWEALDVRAPPCWWLWGRWGDDVERTLEGPKAGGTPSFLPSPNDSQQGMGTSHPHLKKVTPQAQGLEGARVKSPFCKTHLGPRTGADLWGLQPPEL